MKIISAKKYVPARGRRPTDAFGNSYNSGKRYSGPFDYPDARARAAAARRKGLMEKAMAAKLLKKAPRFLRDKVLSFL